jgi:hypothetical protein
MLQENDWVRIQVLGDLSNERFFKRSVEVERVQHGNNIGSRRLQIIISELIFNVLNQEVSNIFDFIICELDILEI